MEKQKLRENAKAKAEAPRDLQLICSLKTVKDIPRDAKNLIVVAEVNNVIHFRVFERGGRSS